MYEPGSLVRSLFWDLAARADPDRHLILKADAATKALVFFGARVGFLTPATDPEAEAALLSKLKCLVRGTVGSASGPALAMVERALNDPALDGAILERHALLEERYQILKTALSQAALPADKIQVLPFNSAFFAFATLHGGLDAEAFRCKLLKEQSVGLIAFPDNNGLRIAYCSIGADRLPDLVEAIASAAR